MLTINSTTSDNDTYVAKQYLDSPQIEIKLQNSPDNKQLLDGISSDVITRWHAASFFVQSEAGYMGQLLRSRVL